MKKRKELDALVSNGKVGSSKRINCIKKGSGSCSAHELLRAETDSSDMEDFSILQPRRKGRKKHGSRFCITSVCLSLCQFILVTTSCLVSGALIWLHIGLREDIDLLRAHLQKVEAGNRNTPEALHVIHSNLKQLDSNVTNIYVDVRKSLVDLDNITNEVKLLKDTAGSLKASIASAPALEQLPKDMQSLSESVANFGSKLTALESNVKELKDQQSNLQTSAQNLSGELDTIKVKMEDLTNSSDFQAKSPVNTPVKDLKLQSSIQETSQHVNDLKEQLTSILTSFGQINATYGDFVSNYSHLPADVKNLKDAIFWINNSTISQNSRLQALESFMRSNLSFLLEQKRSENVSSFKKSGTGDMEEYVNRTITEAILHLINKDVFHSDIQNTLLPLEQTHDVLVLLSALLQKFAQIPQTHILNSENATELVQSMLHQAFEETMASRDMKIEDMEQKIQNLSLCIPLNQSPEASVKDLLHDLTTPVFVESTSKSAIVQKQDPQLEEALG